MDNFESWLEGDNSFAKTNNTQPDAVLSIQKMREANDTNDTNDNRQISNQSEPHKNGSKSEQEKQVEAGDTKSHDKPSFFRTRANKLMQTLLNTALPERRLTEQASSSSSHENDDLAYEDDEDALGNFFTTQRSLQRSDDDLLIRAAYNDSDTESEASTASVKDEASNKTNEATYRMANLARNGIHIHPDTDTIPDGPVSNHVQTVLQADASSPELPDYVLQTYIRQRATLAMGSTHRSLESFLLDSIFPGHFDSTYGSATSGLVYSHSETITAKLVPDNPKTRHKVSSPKPNLLVGYSSKSDDGVFNEEQVLAHELVHSRHPQYPEPTGNGMSFPFLAVEFKATAGTSGNLWSATNECAGAAAACLRIVHQLNTTLKTTKRTSNGAGGHLDDSVENIVYTMAIDDRNALVYVAWTSGGGSGLLDSSELRYHMQLVDEFVLSRPQEFAAFRHCVYNVLDWGKGARQTAICKALDIIFDATKKKPGGEAGEAAD